MNMPAGRSTFTKRQKEQTRQQRQRDKAERKNQRKQEKANPGCVVGVTELGQDAAELSVPINPSVDEEKIGQKSACGDHVGM